MRACTLALIATVAATGLARADDAPGTIAEMRDRGTRAAAALKYDEAMHWYRIAADRGDAAAQAQVGQLYELARGVPEDMHQAMSWYRKAADQGDPGAETSVGLLYSNGWGVRQDDGQALIWYRKAADQGYPIAEEFVGVAYTNGLGVAANFQKAKPWLDKAIVGGDTEAEYYLCPPYTAAWDKVAFGTDLTAMDRVIGKIDPNCSDLLARAKAVREKLAQMRPASAPAPVNTASEPSQ